MLFHVIISVLSVTAVTCYRQPRIIDGQPASPGQFPYQVRLSVSFKPEVPPKPNSCGGSLISSRWVLTAAHCLKQAESVLAFLGTVEFNCSDCLAVLSREFIMHETNDIGLVKLPHPVELNDRVQPIALARTRDDLLVGRTVIVSGWSQLTDGQLEYPTYLQYVRLNVISNERCVKSYIAQVILKSKIFALGEDKQSGCQGDSGGPLVVPGESPLLVGVVNFGREEGCTKGFPSVFARVSEFVDWIEDKTGIVVGNSSI